MPPPDAPPSPKAVRSLGELGGLPDCVRRADWHAVSSAPPPGAAHDDGGGMARLVAPLLGDEVRRGCASEHGGARAQEVLRAALLADSAVSTIALEADESRGTAVAAEPTAEVVVDDEERLAMMAGFAEHLEADFWGTDDDDDDDDDEF